MSDDSSNYNEENDLDFSPEEMAREAAYELIEYIATEAKDETGVQPIIEILVTTFRATLEGEDWPAMIKETKAKIERLKKSMENYSFRKDKDDDTD